MLCLSAIWYYIYTIYAAIQFFSYPTQIDPDFHPPTHYYLETDLWSSNGLGCWGQVSS